ncbi:putative tricarboxylate transport protein, mitochondrial [Drosophila miranda]|uniref:putative tricarboxylate transport protein, mitochondrial n=1 Tax=Drosophila miranda TaxID=7229 RepID=UPI0007E70E86|nr:putative tricarboxylate transport protein, mitochondrial [Drosophila miranda]
MQSPVPVFVAASSGEKGLKGIVAGGITGGLEILITYPTEFVKTQLQLDEKGEMKKFNGIADCVKKTVKQNGFFGLYRGLSVLLLGSIPKSAARFGAFEFFSNKMRDESGGLTMTRRFFSGMLAGMTEAVVAVTPMETIKVRFINDQRSAKPKYKGLFHGVGQIVKSDGIGGIYKGLPATVMKQGSNQAIRFFVLFTLKDLYTGRDKTKTVPKPLVGVFGAIAGAASVFGNNPLDVVKTRMQSFDSARYKNTLDCAIQVLRQEGPMAFYKGTVPRLGRVCLDVAITFMIYDTIMDVFNLLWK